MAVAIHLGKVSSMSHSHKDFEAKDWKHHLCWKVLKDHPAHLPPSKPTEENTVELEEEEEDSTERTESPGVSVAESADAKLPASAHTAPVPSKANSRGPGPGAKKTKAKHSMDEHRKKKAKIQEGILAVQQERSANFASHVTNQARAQAFKMAVMAYNAFKDSDPDEAEKYKTRMENIMRNNTLGDNDEDNGESGMPPLNGTGI